MLVAQIEKGQSLIGLASMLGDDGDFVFWCGKRQLWTDNTRMVLAAYRGEQAARAFDRTVSPPSTVGASWFEDLRGELERLREGIELLRSLEEPAALRIA
jgi:hypothetical protein